MFGAKELILFVYGDAHYAGHLPGPFGKRYIFWADFIDLLLIVIIYDFLASVIWSLLKTLLYCILLRSSGSHCAGVRLASGVRIASNINSCRFYKDSLFQELIRLLEC